MDRQKEDSYQIVNYYKRNRTIEMLLMEEFAFSLLYNNIAPDKLQAALDSVGLNRIPNLFLLIQVDDHLNESKRLNTENEFVLKVRIADIICACFERNGLDPVVANLTGTDKLVAFLVMDESVERDNLIVRISNEICEKVNIFAGYSVSICASDPCKNLEDFPRCYERTKTMLQESFFIGKNMQTNVMKSLPLLTSTSIVNELDGVIQNVYLSLSRGNRVLFSRTMVKLFSTLQKNGRSREQTLLLAGKLIDKMDEYTTMCGVKKEKRLSAQLLQYKEMLFSCCYADDICFILVESYEMLREELEKLQGRLPEDAFRETVNQYIKDHFNERIYLEEVAKSCGYSKYYFCRQLKKCFGRGLSDCVNRFRIERAKELLCTSNQSIESIVYEVGFSSANYFEVVFRKEVGMPPTVYRRMHRE